MHGKKELTPLKNKRMEDFKTARYRAVFFI